MLNIQLQEYVTKARSQGVQDEIIKSNLLTAGWSNEEVRQIFNNNTLEPSAPSPPPKAYFSMWDSFEHILMFISMYVLYISLVLMINYLIDDSFPGVKSSASYYVSQSSFRVLLLRGYMASLIVSFPLFSFFFLRITRRTKTNPAIRNLGSRRFLIYATLVITFIVVLSYVVQAVYGFISGNVTLNFILHFLNTVGWSSLIFAYYLSQVKEDRMYYA